MKQYKIVTLRGDTVIGIAYVYADSELDAIAQVADVISDNLTYIVSPA